MDYKDRRVVLTLIGILLLLTGIPIAFLGPLEMYCFYLFSAGGPFYYDGFGFGSFMFGNIAAQIIGYYFIGAVLIPLGYGHLKERRWVRPLSLAALRAWLVVGAPLTPLIFFVLVASKELSLVAAIIAFVLLALSYLAVPALLIRFYRSRDVRLTFEASDPHPSWIDRLPVPLLTLALLLLFYATVLHIPIFFNGIFPLFGRFLFGFEGIAMLAISIGSTLLLVWGMLKRRIWAWWGALISLGLAILSSFWTLVSSSYADILEALRFPPTEMAFLDSIPVEGIHLAIPIAIPPLVTLVLVFLSRRCFLSKEQAGELPPAH
jgi:hypothetical protein